MDMKALVTQPYKQLQTLFADDPATRWAAYVAGAFAVLHQEHGVEFTDSYAILVDSDVPEGVTC